MITKALTDERDRAANRAAKALNRLGESIFARMALIALRLDLDEMVFGACGGGYFRGGREVESKQLDDLDQFYCDSVHSEGPQSVWTPEKGWGA